MSISNDSRKCHGHYIKASRMFRTSSRCSIRLYPGKNGGCSQIIENSQIGMSRYLDTSTESTNGQNHGPVRKIQSFLSKGICTVILWQDCFGKGNWECLFVHREKVLFLSVYVDDIKLAGKKQNLDPMWKVLNKEVDLGEPTSFLDHENLGCTQRQCEISKYIMDHYRAMFESPISAGGEEEKELKNFHSLLGIFFNWECLFTKRARGLFLSVFVDDVKLAGKTENLEPTLKFLMEDVDLGEPTSFLDHKINDDVVASYRDMFGSKFSAGAKEKPTRTSGKLDAETISLWSNDIQSHAKTCVERYCELVNKRLTKYTKYLLHASMTTPSKKKNWNLLENCQKYALKLFWNAYNWHVLEDLIFYGQ